MLVNLNVNGAHIVFMQINYFIDSSWLLNKSNLFYSLENSLNVFYSCNTVFNSCRLQCQLKTIKLAIEGFIILFNILLVWSYASCFSIYIVITLICFVIFKSKFVVFNSIELDIFKDDSAEAAEPGTDDSSSDETADDESNEQKDNLKNLVQTMVSIHKSPALDGDTIIEILLSIIKRRSDDSNNNQCLAIDMYIQKLMCSSGVSKEDLAYLKKSVKISNFRGLSEKIRALNQKKFYSLSELIVVLRSLNKLKNNIIILPNGIVIFTLSEKNLRILSLPAVIKVSQKNLEQIVRMLNLKKKLNLYLTKECYNLGFLWEKSFYASEFLCVFNEAFSKKYLILEDLNIDVIKVIKTKLHYFYCDTSALEETMHALKKITQSLVQKKSPSSPSSDSSLEFSESDLLSNKISADIMLEGVIKIKKMPEPKVEQKKGWFHYIKVFFTYIKNKIQDLTIPALAVYYYCAKLLYLTNLKYALVIIFIAVILYKYVYLNQKVLLILRWVFWGVCAGLYLCFVFILISKSSSWILATVTSYINLFWSSSLLVDLLRILLIYIITLLPDLITFSDIIEEIFYNLRLYINNWIILKLNYWTFLAIYLWPFIYSYKNIKTFIKYAWSVSYYRDPIICYLSKFLAILYLYFFPALFHLKLVNAGRISAWLRWLYWNPEWLTNIKNILTVYTHAFYKNLQFACIFCIQNLVSLFKIIYYSNLLRSVLLKIVLCFVAIYCLICFIDTCDELQDEHKKPCNGFMCYCRFSDTFGDKVKEKVFDLIPLRYKLSFEFVDFEWLKLLNLMSIWLLRYLNSIYIFLVKNLWLYFKHIIYTKYVGSLVEFYCEMHLWIEYYLFKILGDFLQPFFYIPYYVKTTAAYIAEIPWLTFMDMYKLTAFFGLKPPINSLEAYARHRASLLKYQYWFLKNYEYEFNRKRNYKLHVFILQYWKLCLHYQLKQRHETRERILKSWYIWQDKNDTT